MAEGTTYVLRVSRVEAIAADDGVTFEIEGGIPSSAAQAIEKRLKNGGVKFEDADPDGAIYIDGKPFESRQLKFKERQRVFDLIGQLHTGETRFDPRLNAGEGGQRPFDPRAHASEEDIVVATVCVLKQRTDPDFTLEQALDMSEEDIEKPARPTRRSK